MALSGPHQKFAEGIALGLSATDAYLAAYPKASPANAAKNTSRLTKNDEIRREVERIRQEAEKQPGSTLMTLVEKRTILGQIARAGERDSDRISAIKADNDLAGEGSEANSAHAVAAIIQSLTHASKS